MMTRQEIWIMPLQKVVKILQSRHPELVQLRQVKHGSPNVTWDNHKYVLPPVVNARDLLIELEKAQ